MSSHHWASGDEAVEDELSSSGPAVAHVDGELLAAVRADRPMRPSAPSAAQIPKASQRAVAVPPAAARMDAVGSGHRRERVRHPDLAGAVEDEGVRVVQPPPALAHVHSGGDPGLGGGRRPAELDESPYVRLRRRRSDGVHAEADPTDVLRTVRCSLPPTPFL